MIFQPNIIKAGSSTTPEGWYPPADWNWDAASALINDGDNGFVALFMAFPDMENYINFNASFIGTGSIDWGDGSAPQAVTNGVNTYATLDYANIPGGVVASIGCKIAVVKFTCTSTFISLNLSTSHPEANATTPTNWIAMKIRTSGTIIGLTTGQKYGTKCVYLHLLDLGSALLAKTSATYALSYLESLKKIHWSGFEPSNGSKETLFIESCLSPFCNIIDGLGWQYITSLSSCFSSAFGLSSINISIPNCTTIYNAFANAGINSVKLINTGNVASINNCCFGAYTKSFEMDDCDAITNTTNFTYSSYNFFQRLILSGLTVGINLTNGNMSATAINAFLAALGTANGTQIINLAGNPGALTCDVSIGTAKGYTIITA